MGDIRIAAGAAFPDFAVDGVPSSGAKEPRKSDVRAAFGVVEDRVEKAEALAVAGVKWLKGATIRVRSTGNVAIATDLENGDTLNGVVLATGDHVFLGLQTSAAENGVYTVAASGAAARAAFADSPAELAYIGLLISEGDAGAGERWTLPMAAADLTLGSTALAFAKIGVEVDVSGEVATARGEFSTLGENVSDLRSRVDATGRAEAAIGRAALYGITDPVAARLFAQRSRELDFANDFFRSGFEPLAGPEELAGWTFSRSSDATAEPSGGALTTFAAGEPRITNRGLLIEGASTQGANYSGAIGSWTKTNVTITDASPDYAGAPAKNVAATTSAATQILMDGAGISAAAPGSTAWCVIGKGTGALVANAFAVVNLTTSQALVILAFNYDTGAVDVTFGNPGDVQVYPQDAGWWLLAITPSSGISDGDGLRFYTGFGGGPQTAGDYFRMSHCQIENEPFPTSRIVNNSGAASERAADSVQLTFSPLGDFTIFLEAEMAAHSREETLFSIDDGSDNNRLTLSRLADGTIRLLTSRRGLLAQAEVPGKSGARVLKVAVSSSASVCQLSIDGSVAYAINQGRPVGLNRCWLGRTSSGLPLGGHIIRHLVVEEALTESSLRSMTAPAGVASLSQAPTIGNPLQGRFNPITAITPDGLYGRVPVVVYGELPCALFICEMKGPSALAIARDGTTMFRDALHLGRWIDVDPLTGLCLAGDGTYRTVRWLNHAGLVVKSWAVDVGIPGEIYGLRTDGEKLVINMIDGSTAETWIWTLDADGFPTGSGTEFTAFSGAGKGARSMLIDGNTLWVAAMDSPTNPQGCVGALQAYNLTTGALIDSYYGHYPNDVDRLPNGDIVWLDEHLDRLRAVTPSTDAVRSVMAGLEICHDYEPGVGSISANTLARATSDGSGLEGSAVEYRGLRGLYAPNGVAVIADGLYAIADTDNGRVIVARATETWEPEILAVIAHLNEPTKVRIIPAS